MKIGVMVESFRVGLEGGLKAAAELGVDGVQLYARHGGTDLCRLTVPERVHLSRRIADAGLELSAVVADCGGYGFEREAENPQRIDRVKRAIDLARDLGCRVVSDHIGVVPSDRSHPRYGGMARACEAVGRHAASAGATFAIETGPEPAPVLRGLLDDVGLPGGPTAPGGAQGGLGVNFDPANLVMVFNARIPAAVEALGPYIVHTHAKDGRQLKPVDAETLYHAFAEGGIEGFHAGDFLRELPLGEGDVHFETYLAALRRAGYDGYLTIEREVGENPRNDIEQAVQFLRRLLV